MPDEDRHGDFDSHDEIEPHEETTPLLTDAENYGSPPARAWEPPPGFYWIELGELESCRDVGSMIVLMVLTIFSNLLKRVPFGIRRDNYCVDICSDRIRVQRRQYDLMAHDLVSDNKHGVSAPLWQIFRYSRSSNLFLHSNMDIPAWMSWVRLGC